MPERWHACPHAQAHYTAWRMDKEALGTLKTAHSSQVQLLRDAWQRAMTEVARLSSSSATASASSVSTDTHSTQGLAGAPTRRHDGGGAMLSPGERGGVVGGEDSSAASAAFAASAAAAARREGMSESGGEQGGVQ